MQLTAILRIEHERITALLEALKSMSTRLKAVQSVDVCHPDRAVFFLRNYADRLHHAKEEKLLFKVMEKQMPEQAGEMVGELIADHTLGRMLVDSLAAAADSYASGVESAGREFADAAEGYCHFLTHHICVEENILYPMAEQYLPTEKVEELDKSMLAESSDVKIEKACLKILADLIEAYGLAFDNEKMRRG